MSEFDVGDINTDFNKLLELYNSKITKASPKQNTNYVTKVKEIFTKYNIINFYNYINNEDNVKLFILVLSILSIDNTSTLFNELKPTDNLKDQTNYTSYTRPIDKIYKNSIYRYVAILTTNIPEPENILEYLEYMLNNILPKLKINNTSRGEYDNKSKIDKLIIVKYKNSKLYMKNLVKHFNHNLKPI